MKYEWHGVAAFSLIMLFACLQVSGDTSLVMGSMLLLSGYFSSYYTAYHGWMTKRYRLGRGYDPDAFGMHRWCVLLVTSFIVSGVIGIEVGVRKLGGLWGDPWFIALHFLLVILMVIFFLLVRFKHTGERNPAHHRWYALMYMVFYTGALVTGGKLLLER